MATPQRECPFCTIFLVLGALAANICVLVGNIETANAYHRMGESAKGWSGVGTGMANAFNSELSLLFNKVSIDMSKAVQDIVNIQSKIDSMISTVGGTSDKSMLQMAQDISIHGAAHNWDPTAPTLQEIEDQAIAKIREVANKEVGEVAEVMDKFIDKISPVLIQAGKWEVSFGTTLQNDITQFGTVIDWVQKAFDEIMSKIHGGDLSWTDYMLYNTFSLFDQQGNGCITLDDLLKVSVAYGITAISGTKGESVFADYAVDGCVGVEQYKNLVNAHGLSGIMGTILRTYAEDLSEIGGVVGQARLRDEVSSAVVDYLTLVSAKNLTKVRWISNRLTNESVPQAFTACVLYELASDVGDPSLPALVDTGAIVLNDMMELNANWTLGAWDLLKSPAFWYSQGLLDDTLPEVVAQVGQWIGMSINASIAAMNATMTADEMKKAEIEAAQMAAEKMEEEKMAAMTTTTTMTTMTMTMKKGKDDKGKDDKGKDDMGKGDKDSKKKKKKMTPMALIAESRGLVKEGELALSLEQIKSDAKQEVKRHKHARKMEGLAHREQLQSSATSKHLFRQLLGGRTMQPGLTPTEWQTLHQGVLAVPATLQFAKFLADNCSLDSSQYQHAVFEFTATSSNQLDSFANNIQNFAKKVVSFLSTVDQYTGESGIATIKSELDSFLQSAEESILNTVIPKIKMVIAEVIKKAQQEGKSTEEIIQELEHELEDLLGMKMPMMALVQEGNSSSMTSDAMLAFETVAVLMDNLMSLLPSAVNTVNSARQETVEVAEVMVSIFNMFSVKGPAIFDAIAKYYKLAWTIYFILLLPFTLGILWYGMWASGFMGGPQPEETDYKPPETCMDRLKACKDCCCTCLSRCHDSQLCFWSCIIVFQIIVLLIFIVALAICLLAGVKMFFTSACAELYLLNEADVCYNDLAAIKSFIPAFVVDEFLPLEETCSVKELTMCKLIGSEMKQSVVLTTIFGIISAILSFQLVIESAVLHERAKMRRIVSGLKSSSDMMD